jgi:hypothetical protein
MTRLVDPSIAIRVVHSAMWQKTVVGIYWPKGQSARSSSQVTTESASVDLRERAFGALTDQ